MRAMQASQNVLSGIVGAVAGVVTLIVTLQFRHAFSELYRYMRIRRM